MESLSSNPGNAQRIVALNSAAALYVGGAAPTLKEGFVKAMETIKSGVAREKLDNFVKYTSTIQKN